MVSGRRGGGRLGASGARGGTVVSGSRGGGRLGGGGARGGAVVSGGRGGGRLGRGGARGGRHLVVLRRVVLDGTDKVLTTSLHHTGEGRAGSKGHKSNGGDHFEKLKVFP